MEMHLNPAHLCNLATRCLYRVLFFASVSISPLMLAHGQTVPVYSPSQFTYPSGYHAITVNANAASCDTAGRSSPCVNPPPSAVVYTTAAVDSKIAAISTQDAQAITSQISTAQATIESDLKASLDKLPQALLTDAAKSLLEQRILADLKPQLDSLQQQIDALKGSGATPSTRTRMNVARAHRGQRRTAKSVGGFVARPSRSRPASFASTVRLVTRVPTGTTVKPLTSRAVAVVP
jgi:hypothetical protein